MNNKGKGFRNEYLILVVFITFILAIILSITLIEINQTAGTILAIIAVLLLFTLILLIMIFIEDRNADKRKRKKPSKSQRKYKPQGNTTYLTRSQSNIRRNISTSQKQPKKTSKIIVIPLDSFTFTKDSEDYLCMVCKLTIRKNQLVVMCPFCQSYFHKEHFYDWLKIADDCPVCNSRLKIQKK